MAELNEMKFLEIKIGDTFTLEGEAYLKISPLIARHLQTDKQRLFKRADIVSHHSSTGTANSLPQENQITSETVSAAFDEFYSICTSLITGLEKQPQDFETTSGAQVLEQAKRRFLMSLEEVKP